MSIYIGNLNYEITQEDLQEVFTDYGTVTRVHLPTDRETGRVRGFAFVEMEDETDEERAIEELDGAEWMDRRLRVNKAKPRQDKRSSSGGRQSFGRSRSRDF
ncbi:RNA recognition motif domain-containing protein [Baaleninema sp.]|uniref:RNA recognition motif domain-containing protein n=1 Tax=Baaleninema sp. TaxID=3101197 RepID=UPI003D06A1BF